MRIVIIGAGVVGFHLAEQLSTEGHDISVVDSDPDLVRRLDDRFDVIAVAGDAATPSVLRMAGTSSADLVVAVTNSDTTNLIASLTARNLGARKRIVRVRNAEYTDEDAILTPEDVGADVLINPIATTADLLERLVRTPGANDVAEFAEGELLLWGFTVEEDSPIAGIALKDLREQSPQVQALIVAIARPDGTVVIPRGDDAVQAGDDIYVFTHRKATRQFRKLAAPSRGSVDRLVICGATQLGVEIARRLEGRVKSINLVEPERARAEAASERLSRAMVLCGDVADPAFAREYGFASVDYFLALDDDDQTNLMNALLVKKYGAAQVAVLAQQPQFIPVLTSLGMRTVVTPRLLTVNAILRYIRRGRIHQVSRIRESGAEACEYELAENSVLVGKTLQEAAIPRGVIVGAIFRGDNYIIPTGETVAQAGDHFILFALPEAMASMEKLFSKRRLFIR